MRGEGKIRIAEVTRFLSKKDFTQADYWRLIKPILRNMETRNGVISIDDTIEMKPYTDENDIFYYHYDHSKRRSVKGINIMTLFYSCKIALPLRYEIIKKDEYYTDEKGKICRKSKKTKNELFRSMLRDIVFVNHIKFGYIFADS